MRILGEPRLLAGVLMLLWGCAAQTDASRARPTYDEFSRRLLSIYADQDGDGRIDQWSYFTGNLVLRGEKDSDRDGRVDRWEYFDAAGALSRVGTSSRNDGIEDEWTWVAPENGEGRVDRSRARDRRIDRRDYFREGVLVRAEEDSNADGRTDRWDRYEGKVLRQVEFDTTLTHGRPDRRALYGAGGSFDRLEADPEFDGVFVQVSGAAAPNLKGGAPR